MAPSSTSLLLICLVLVPIAFLVAFWVYPAPPTPRPKAITGGQSTAPKAAATPTTVARDAQWIPHAANSSSDFVAPAHPANETAAAARRLRWATACLALSGVASAAALPPYAEYADHCAAVLRATAPYRPRRATVYKGIQNDFLIHFAKLFVPLGPRPFWPLVPLFIDECPPLPALRRLLDPRFIYVAVAMGECGLDNVTTWFPNLLILSANGYGHVPIPLVASHTLPLSTPRSRPIALSWCGRTWPGVRERMRQVLAARHFPVQERHGPDWAAAVAASQFTLCPRGNGRTSFRLFEALQLGTIPVYIWDDCPWLPYQGAVDWARLAVLVDLRNLSRLPTVLRAIGPAQQAAMRAYGQALRADYFTLSGVLRQLQRWLADPFASALACRPLPCSPGNVFPCARRRGVKSRPHVSFCCNRSRCPGPLAC